MKKQNQDKDNGLNNIDPAFDSESDKNDVEISEGNTDNEVSEENIENLENVDSETTEHVEDTDESNTSIESEKDNDVHYETNDNWQFEAEAPTLNSELELGENSELVLDAPQEEDKPTKKEKNKNKEQDTIVIKKSNFKVIGYAILAIIIVVVLVLAGIYYYNVPNSNEKMNPGNVALDIDGTKVSIGMYNYYYDYLVQNYETYASYGYYDLDTSTSFDEQYTTDDDGNTITWLERFQDDTVYQIKYLVSYYNEGVKHGITITEDQQEEMQSQIESIEDAAASAELSVNEYVEQNYGNYCGIKTIEKILEMNYIGQTYYYEAQIGFNPTTEEAEAYAEENRDNYLSCNFAYLEMVYDTTDDDTMAASVDKAEEYCDNINNLDDLISYIPEALSDIIEEYIAYGYFESEEDAVEQFAEQVEVTESKTDLASMLGDDIAEWLFSDDTEIGDTNYTIDTTYGYIYILLKTNEPALDDTELYSVRHILVIPGEDSEEDSEDADSEDAETEDADTEEEEDTSYTDEEWDAAYDKATEILDEYNDSEQTEEVFASFAEKYSDDTESTSAGSSGIYGGLYDGVSLGEMVSPFEDWATDSERQFGDTGIVKSDYGYHIMYFIFDGPTYLYNASSDLKSENEKEFISSCSAKIKKSGFKNTNKAQPVVETTTESSTDTTAATDSE